MSTSGSMLVAIDRVEIAVVAMKLCNLRLEQTNNSAHTFRLTPKKVHMVVDDELNLSEVVLSHGYRDTCSCEN